MARVVQRINPEKSMSRKDNSCELKEKERYEFLWLMKSYYQMNEATRKIQKKEKRFQNKKRQTGSGIA